MRSRKIFPLLLCVGLFLLLSNYAKACLMVAPVVTEQDIQHPPKNMIAFSGEIIDIKLNGRIDQIPHDGFEIKFKPTIVRQGIISTDNVITVAFGPCHQMPGKAGDTIPVLALPDKAGGWYAPQFWDRSE